MKTINKLYKLATLSSFSLISEMIKLNDTLADVTFKSTRNFYVSFKLKLFQRTIFLREQSINSAWRNFLLFKL